MMLKQYIGAKNDTKQYKTIQKDTKSDDTFLQKYAIQIGIIARGA